MKKLLLTICCITVALGLGLARPATAGPFFMGLGDLPGGATFSHATGVSADGSVVVGASGSASGPGGEAFR